MVPLYKSLYFGCCRHLKEAKNTYSHNKRLHTFSIGIEGAPDLLAARSVAQHLGTHHHEFHFTVQEGLDALWDLIWHIESYEQVKRWSIKLDSVSQTTSDMCHTKKLFSRLSHHHACFS